MSDNKNCSNCQFSAQWSPGPESSGACLRYPPRDGRTVFVMSDDWCGEWKPKIASPVQPGEKVRVAETPVKKPR